VNGASKYAVTQRQIIKLIRIQQVFWYKAYKKEKTRIFFVTFNYFHMKSTSGHVTDIVNNINRDEGSINVAFNS
jgi:hypothetical protein